VHTFDHVVEQALRQMRIVALENFPDQLCEFVLLDLQSVRVLGVLAQHVEIEFGDLTGASIAVLVVATDQTLRSSSAVTPSSSIMSTVGGWKVEARKARGNSAAPSSKMIGIPACTSRNAATQPRDRRPR
jgi:hypothetical protein